MQKPILLLARISNALLSTVLSLRPVTCAFAAALRVNTQTIETQSLQVPRRFCRIMSEPGLMVSNKNSYFAMVCHAFHA